MERRGRLVGEEEMRVANLRGLVAAGRTGLPKLPLVEGKGPAAITAKYGLADVGDGRQGSSLEGNGCPLAVHVAVLCIFHQGLNGSRFRAAVVDLPEVDWFCAMAAYALFGPLGHCD